MKIQVVSDIHLEFEPDLAAEDLCGSGPQADVLVIAGDLTAGGHKAWEDGAYFLEEACDLWPHVIYVLGNHECYHTTRATALSRVRDLAEDLYENFHFLENEIVEIDGVRFLGTTLWFALNEEDHRYEGRMNDFRLIQDIHEVNKWSWAASAFLGEGVKEGDVVITHHLPLPRSIAKEFKTSSLNRFFLHNKRHLIEARKPALWIHGHTHSPFDYMHRDTRVVCNPHGYAGREDTSNFELRKVVEVQPPGGEKKDE